jgi:hypothetical protein
MKHKFLLVTIVVLLMVGCNRANTAENTPTPEPPTPEAATTTPTLSGPLTAEAQVDSIQILTLESFPVQINVLARGELPDGCTVIDNIQTTRTGNAFSVRVQTIRPADAVCTQALVSFAETIPLDVVGLAAGTYTVTVNGISGSFTLATDNELSAATTPTPAATTDANSAEISGLVWHDLCAVAGDETTPAAGCVAAEDGSLTANGLLEADEPGIAGVVVNLGEGECPATGLDSATTDEDGQYRFTGLAAGTYCVSVDPLDDTNTGLLVPGMWTYPVANVGSAAVTLTAGQTQGDVNFGWDYQFLPLPEVDFTTCTNSIEFVEDLTVPDNTIFPPGAEFTKSWRLRNNGTCPWTTSYSLVSVGGDDIPGPQSVPFTEPVAPGQPVDVSVTLTAPAAPGTYRENWQISDANGQPFGVNGFIGDAFWLQIVVEEGVTPSAPGAGAISGVVWDDSCFLLSGGGPSRGCVETADGSGVYVADGTLNFGEVGLSDIVVTLARGACPAEGAIPPASVLETVTTDADGLYRFDDLAAGTYCIGIDAFSTANVDLLIPGDWTYPARGVGRLGIVLAPGDERDNVDFGWDFRE